MLTIDIKNVEELIFYNKPLRKKLSEFQDLYNQWTLGKQAPTLKFLSQKALMSFLERLKNDHIKILEDHFKEEIKVRAIDYHTVRNHKIPIAEAEKVLCETKGFKDNFCVCRNGNHLYISFWR